MKLPIKLGSEGGYNANNVTDADHEPLFTVYRIPLHRKVDEVDPVKYAEGLAVARKIVLAVNSRDALVEALDHVLQCFHAARIEGAFDEERPPEWRHEVVARRLLFDLEAKISEALSLATRTEEGL